MIGAERKDPGQYAHVEPLEERPFPGIGFATNDGDGADALQREDVKDHQRYSNQRRVNGSAIRMSLESENFGEAFHARFGFLVFPEVVNYGHGADKNLARGE